MNMHQSLWCGLDAPKAILVLRPVLVSCGCVGVGCWVLSARPLAAGVFEFFFCNEFSFICVKKKQKTCINLQINVFILNLNFFKRKKHQNVPCHCDQFRYINDARLFNYRFVSKRKYK